MKSEFTNNEKMGLQEVPEQERAYESELAVDITDRIISIQELEDGYDYSIYGKDYCYGCNSLEQINSASEWFKAHGYSELGDVMVQGFDENNQQQVGDWIFDNIEMIYSAYRYIMLLFEQTCLS